MFKPSWNKVIGNTAGFSLVEVMAVLFLVSMGLIGVLALLVQSMQVRYINRNAMTAYSLAQEGIELVRHVRDSNWRQSEPWLTGLAAGEYCLDYQDPVPVSTSGQGCRLYIGADGFYDHVNSLGDQASPFYRKVSVSAVATSSAVITADISWTDHSKSYGYHLETILYDWK